MTKYIIGTISNIDRPMNPAAKGDRSMNLYMNHVSQEMIRTERSQILHAAQEDIRCLLYTSCMGGNNMYDVIIIGTVPLRLPHRLLLLRL